MKSYRTFGHAVFMGLTVLHLSLPLGRAQSPGFTYQGKLDASGSPFTGSAEFQPTLWDAVSAGTQVAPNNPATIIVGVTNGLFVLPLDFGTAPFGAGADRWLQIQVRTTIGPFTTLTPRQKLTATPYALQAANAAVAAVATTANSVNAANIIGQLGLAQVPPTVITNTQTGVNLNGSFNGNGGALSNLSPNALVFTGTNVSIASWGWNEYGQRNIPTGLDDVVAAAAGATHGLALRANGTVVAWGAGQTNDPASLANRGQAIVPAGLSTVTAVAAGYLSSLALKANGTVVAWGWNDTGQTNVPAGLNGVRAIASGYLHNLALKSNGTVVAWGTNDLHVLDVPPGLSGVKAIAAGFHHSLALLSNGTVVAWGTNDFGGTSIPAGLNNVTAISAGATISMALKTDGTIVAWGTNQNGELDVPPGLNNVVGISAGLQQGAVLKADGTVVAWGWNIYGQTNVPPGLNNVVSLAPTFGYHYLALRRKSTAPVAWLDSDNTFNGSIQVNGDVHASGEISAGGGLRLSDQNLWLRGGGDNKNALGWYGEGKQFGNGTPSGPVLFGDSGGALGTYGTNGYHVALKWDQNERVTIGGNSTDAALLFGGGNGIAANGGSQFQFFLSGFGGNRFSFLNGFNGSEMFTIQPSGFDSFGNVGIGTPSPNARLEVRGNIKLGTSGELNAPGSPETLRIIRGTISGVGAILAGSGFTVVRTGAGAYTINFATSFSGFPTVTATVQAGTSRIATVTNVAVDSAQVRTFQTSNEVQGDLQFHFIAIGPR